jgi:hypothetical protein
LAAGGVVAVAVLAANRLSANASSAASCTTTGSGAIADSNTICYTEPATYVTTVYEIGLCRSEPSAPTASVAMDLTTNCVATFQSATGVEVSVRKGAPTALSGGTITAPPAGTYTYGYAILSPTFRISGSFDFESSRRPEQLPSATAGTKCWTTTGETYLYTPTLVMPIECGTTPPSSPGEVTSKINSFSETQADYDFQRVDTDGTHKAYLLTSGLKLGSSVTDSSFGTGSTAVSRMVGLAPMQVTVTSSTQTMDLAIAMSKGATFVPGATQSGQRTIFGIFSGPPTLAMSVQ